MWGVTEVVDCILRMNMGWLDGAQQPVIKNHSQLIWGRFCRLCPYLITDFKCGRSCPCLNSCPFELVDRHCCYSPSQWPWLFTPDHLNLISSSLNPSDCLWQIRRSSLRVFLSYPVRKNRKKSNHSYRRCKHILFCAVSVTRTLTQKVN